MSSAQQLLLTALRCDIDNLNHLATTADIVSDVSQFIHVLQRERGASTIYLASKGKRFKTRRATYLQHSQAAEARCVSVSKRLARSHGHRRQRAYYAALLPSGCHWMN